MRLTIVYERKLEDVVFRDWKYIIRDKRGIVFTSGSRERLKIFLDLNCLKIGKFVDQFQFKGFYRVYELVEGI